VIDGVENARSVAWANGHKAIGLGINRQPGANVIETAEAIKAKLPATHGLASAVDQRS